MGRHEGRASAAGADLVVESTDVQGCVPGGILGSRLSSVEKQVFQVLGVAPLTGLGGRGAEARSDLVCLLPGPSLPPGQESLQPLLLPAPFLVREQGCQLQESECSS